MIFFVTNLSTSLGKKYPKICIGHVCYYYFTTDFWQFSLTALFPLKKGTQVLDNDAWFNQFTSGILVFFRSPMRGYFQ